MQLLRLEENQLIKKGAIHTAREIAGQPALWGEIAEGFFRGRIETGTFLQEAYKEADNIILTGAGTSAFIGLSLAGVFFRRTGLLTRPVATTDIVSHPRDFFDKNHTPIIISFARSGNSPESCAALELAEHFSKKCFHLVVTCDGEGALAQYASGCPTHVVVLPEASNDKSLAMTGSYSGMLLTGLMIAYLTDTAFISKQLELIKKAGNNILRQAALLQEVAEKKFTRAVFLGSGNLYGTATEAALKLQELTDGRVICKTDSYLGIRHGPKAVIDDQTLVVYFLSNNNYVKKYECDLVAGMKAGNEALFELGIGENTKGCGGLDAQVGLSIEGESIDEDFMPVAAIVAGQLLGFYKSLQLELSPDEPSVRGAISRVVQGVNIYPFDTNAAVARQER